MRSDGKRLGNRVLVALGGLEGKGRGGEDWTGALKRDKAKEPFT